MTGTVPVRTTESRGADESRVTFLPVTSGPASRRFPPKAEEVGLVGVTFAQTFLSNRTWFHTPEVLEVLVDLTNTLITAGLVETLD